MRVSLVLYTSFFVFISPIPAFCQNAQIPPEFLCDSNSRLVTSINTILALKPTCLTTEKLSTSTKYVVNSLDDAVQLTKASPLIRSLDFSYIATKYTYKESLSKAFAPSFGIQAGSLSSALLKTKTSYNYSTLNGRPSNLKASDVSSTYTNQVSATPYFSQPVFQPQSILISKYYENISTSTAYSTTDTDLQQLLSSAQSFVNLWVSNKQIDVSLVNVKASLDALNATSAQYKVGLLAKPDLAAALSTYRTYQNSLVNSLQSFNTSFYSLASSIGVDARDLSVSPSAYSQNLSNIVTFKGPYDKDSLKKLVVLNSSSIFSSVYEALGFQYFSKSYLAAYLPSFALVGTLSPNRSSSVYSETNNGNLVTAYTDTSSNLSSSSSIALTFNWLIFDSLANYYSSRQYKSTSQFYFEQAKNTAVTKTASSFSALEAYLFSLKSVELIASGISASQRSYYDTLLAVKAGFSDTTTLIQRLNTLNSQRSSYYSTLGSLLNSVLQLQYLTRLSFFRDFNPYNLPFSESILSKSLQ